LLATTAGPPPEVLINIRAAPDFITANGEATYAWSRDGGALTCIGPALACAPGNREVGTRRVVVRTDPPGAGVPT